MNQREYRKKISKVYKELYMKDMVKIQVDLTDEEFLFIAKKAHDLDITFNRMCEEIILEYLDELETKAKKKQDLSRKPTRKVVRGSGATNKVTT